MPAQHSNALTIMAEGNAVCKAVSVAEIVKRRLRGMYQANQIGLATPPRAAGQSAESATAAPTIAITLSMTPLDASQPGFQPPLTDEELHGAWILDDEAMQLDRMELGDAGQRQSGRERKHGLAAGQGAERRAGGEELLVMDERVDDDGHSRSARRVRSRKRKRGNGRSRDAPGALRACTLMMISHCIHQCPPGMHQNRCRWRLPHTCRHASPCPPASSRPPISP